MDNIFIIVWVGRDADSGVWDRYPYMNFGYFRNRSNAEAACRTINKYQGCAYDPDADEEEHYEVEGLCPHENSEGAAYLSHIAIQLANKGN